MRGNEISLIGTGITLGIVHVLTGPDHLSALATLSANVGDVQQAFFLGIRWGLGHSTGLLLVGIILIAWDAGVRRQQQAAAPDDGSSNETMIHVPDNVSHFFESLVGIFMLLLGAYGIQRAWEKRPKVYYYYDYGTGILPSSSSSSRSHEDYGGSSSTRTAQITTATAIGQGGGQLEAVGTVAAVASASMDLESYHNHTMTQHLSDQQQQEVEDSPLTANSARANDDAGNEQEMKSSFLHSHAHSHHHDHFSLRDDGDERAAADDDDSSCRWIRQCSRRISARTLAVCAGIVHGLAGPGGVLGVIPAVQLHSGKLATIYLASFCLSSTLTMGLFAIFYGTCSNRLGGAGLRVQRVQGQGQGQHQDAIGASTMNHPPATAAVASTNNTQCEFLIECISALLSILVGITWLTLLSIGKLEDVFP